MKIGYHSVFSEFPSRTSADAQEVLGHCAQITGETPTPPEQMTDKEYDKVYPILLPRSYQAQHAVGTTYIAKGLRRACRVQEQ